MQTSEQNRLQNPRLVNSADRTRVLKGIAMLNMQVCIIF